MKTHTSEFKNTMKQFGKQIDCKITYYIDGEKIELGAEELNSITPTYQGGILKTVMKELYIDSNVEIPMNTIINCKFGLLINDEYEYIDYGSYIVNKVEEQKDTGSYKIDCYDLMLRTMISYDKLQTGVFPMTVREYIKCLCDETSLEFENENVSFANFDKVIKEDLYKELGYTYRTILDEIAQVTASTICVNNNNKLEIRYINETNDTIDEEYLKDININFGEKYGPINSIVLSRAEESDNVYLQDEQSVEQNGLCEIKIVDNQIMNFNDRSEYLQDILYQLDGLQYYLNDYSSPGICYYDLCDKYNVRIEDNIYGCIMFNDEVNISQGLEENIFTEKPEETETDYKSADKTDMKLNKTYLLVDKQNQKIEGVIENVDGQNEKIAQISLTVDELNSKISDIANITVENQSEYGNVELNDVNASEPIYIRIYPIGKNISYSYPHNQSFPQNDFDGIRILRFTNTKTGEIIKDYELPQDLLYYDKDNYDEFILDYEKNNCVVNQICDYNSDGEVIKLDTMIINTYDFPDIQLTDGDYKVELLEYDNGFINVRLMASNIYTTQFYTKVETDSRINQRANEIELGVDQKFTTANGKIDKNSANILINSTSIKNEVTRATSSEDEINGKLELKVGKNDNNQIVSMLNASASEINLNGGSKINLTTAGKLLITAGNFKLDKNGNMTANNGVFNGTINSTNGNIAGWEIKNDKLYRKYQKGDYEYEQYVSYEGIQGTKKEIGSPFAGDIMYWLNTNDGWIQCQRITTWDTDKQNSIHGSLSTGDLEVRGSLVVNRSLNVYGSKNRIVKTNNYGTVKLNAYETTTPYFGDIGSNKTDENGICKIYIEDIFKETIELENYKVFIQECNEGHLYVKKYKDYFEVIGTPNLEFDWEIKAIQKDYKNIRLEKYEEENEKQ